MGDETWLPVRGYEGLYEVSDHGRVRSHKRQGTQGLILKPYPKPTGHLTVGLKRNDRLKKKYVHVLVLEAFVGPRPDGMECCHGDGDETNNHVSNLRWDTSKANKQDMLRHGRHYLANRTHCPRGHVLQLPNLRASVLARGHRDCLACHRARAYAKHHGLPLTKELADRYYDRVIAGDFVKGTAHVLPV